MTEAAAFSGRLLPSERVLWSGRPSSGLLFRTSDVFLIPFSALWCIFIIFWVVGAGRGGPFVLFGLPFVVIGVFISVGRFALDARLRRNTAYALTDKRVLILRSKPFADFVALGTDRLPQAQLTERVGGRGTVRFGPSSSVFGYHRAGFSIWVPALDSTPQFIAIPEARRVFDMVQQLATRSG